MVGVGTPKKCYVFGGGGSYPHHHLWNLSNQIELGQPVFQNEPKHVR